MNPPEAARRRLGPEEDTMTNRRSMIYAKFEVFEEQLAHCYFMLHERFIANPPLAKFWAETAMDELQKHRIHCADTERHDLPWVSANGVVYKSRDIAFDMPATAVDAALESDELDRT